MDYNQINSTINPTTTNIDSKLIVGTRNNHNLTKELVRRTSPQLPTNILKKQQPP